MRDRVRVGEGAGGTDAWISPARDLAVRGELDYLTFECLAERTIALAQTERLHRPDRGYDRLLGRLDPDLRFAETGQRIDDLGGRVVWANAYLGSDPILAGLAGGADVVITGRVADP